MSKKPAWELSPSVGVKSPVEERFNNRSLSIVLGAE